MKTILFTLLSFIGLTAMVSGSLMISNPDGVIIDLSLNLLDETPFRDFFFPGIFLALTGAVNLIAVLYNIMQHPARYNWAIAGGFLISGWIIAQVILIQTIHWLQFLYFGLGILVILLAYQLKGKWAA